MAKMITTNDLPDLIGTSHPRLFLHCPCCLERYSAHKGDYFWRGPNEPFVCERCEEPLELVRERITFERIA